MARRTLEVQLIGDASSLTRAFGKGEAGAAKFGVGMGGALKSSLKFGAISAGIGGVGIALSKIGTQTIDFDKSMRNVNSLAQLGEGSFKKLSGSVLTLAGKTAQAPVTLANGLYDLVSSGFSAGQSMLILKSSAKAATAGLTTTEVSTKAVAAVLNAYHEPASKAAEISDVLFQTVNKGVISFEQLSTTIGDVLPFASSLGVNLKEVGAATATLTKAGISPEETMTRIKNVMVTLLKPGDALQAAFKKLGVASGEALIKEKGFQGALEALVGTTDGSKAAVAQLFPNIRSLGGALALTGKNAKGAEKDLASFKDVTGATDKALSQQSKSISYQWNKIKAVFSSLAIQGGSVLIPAMGSVLNAVGKAVGKVKELGSEFNKLRHSPKQDVPKGFPVAAPEKGAFSALGTMIKEGVKSVDWGGVGDALSEGFTKGVDFAGKLTPAVTQGITTAFGQVNSRAVIGTFVDGIGTAVSELLNPGFWIHHIGAALSIVTVVIPLGKILKIPGFGWLYSKISGPLKDIVVKAVGGIGSGFASAFKKVAADGLTGLLGGIEQYAPKTAHFLLNLVTRSGTIMSTLGGKFKAAGSKAVNGLVGAIGSGVGKAAGAAGRLIGGAIKAIADGTGPMRAAAGHVVSSGVAEIRAGVGNFVAAGGDLIRGLASGIAGAIGSALSAIANVAKSVVGKAKSLLHINSPSKVFHEIGLGVTEGLADGINAGSHMTRDAITGAVIFPLEQSIAALTEQQSAMQAGFDKADKIAERAALVAAKRRAGGAKAIQAEIDKLQQRKRDLPSKGSAAERKKLTDEIAHLQIQKRHTHSSGNLGEATKALKDFDKEASRAKALSKIDVQVKGLDQVRNFKAAISDLRSEIADKLNEAVDKFRSNWEATTGKAIDAANAATLKDFDKTTEDLVAAGPATAELAKMRGEDKAAAMAKEDADNQTALSDAQYLVAHSGGKVHEAALKQLKDAEEQIAATKRLRDEDKLEADAAVEAAGIIEQRANDRAALEDQMASDKQARMDADVAAFTTAEQAKLDVLTASLEAQLTSYKSYVDAVNAELARIGVSGIDPSPDQESVLTPGYSAFGQRPQKHASGGWTGLVLNELGPERLYANRAGGVMVQQASEVARGGGGGGTVINFNGPVGSQKAARVIANHLAFRLRYG